MISASERCSLWEEAVNVLCMLLASRSMAQYGMVGIFHAFKQSPLNQQVFFLTVITGFQVGSLYFPLQVGGGFRWQG